MPRAKDMASSILEKNKKELYTLELKIKEIEIKKERLREDMERFIKMEGQFFAYSVR